MPANASAALPALSDATALIVVDVQNGFDDPRWGRRNNPDAEAKMAALIAGFRAMGRPVIHIRHDSVEPDSPLRPGQAGNATKDEVAPVGGEPVYAKTVNSAFIGTTLEADLRRDGVDTVVIVGLTTNHCVSTTARMAGNFGLRTFIVADATATFDRATVAGRIRPAAEVHEAALSDLSGEFATVVDTETMLALAGRRRDNAA